MNTARQELKDHITSHLEQLEKSDAPIDVFATAQKFEASAYRFSHDEISELVREVARSLGITFYN